MKVVVSSTGKKLSSAYSPRFGRCPVFLFVDTDSMQFESVVNQAADAAGGAGIQAAQLVVGAEVQAVITGRVGPNAERVLQTAGIPVYLFQGGTVKEAVEDFKAKRLPVATGDEIEPTQPKRHDVPAASSSRDKEIATLEGEVAELRKRLTGLLERIDQV